MKILTPVILFIPPYPPVFKNSHNLPLSATGEARSMHIMTIDVSFVAEEQECM